MRESVAKIVSIAAQLLEQCHRCNRLRYTPLTVEVLCAEALGDFPTARSGAGGPHLTTPAALA